MNFSKAEAQIVASLERAEIEAVPPDMAYHERRGICGCGYDAKGYATRDEVRRMARLLSLQPGRRILDVGAGTGWPGLYFAKETGCEVVLVDLPLSELRAANRRAVQDRISDRCRVTVADGSRMPFRDGSFDAVSHSDVLCCLEDKRGVLESCRRVIRDDGRMAFTVIWITPGLSRGGHKRALKAAPRFAESETDYPTLLGQTGWTVTDCLDVSETYGSSNGAVKEGLLRRDLFVATPALT
jgi:cyclopropane fatty-acyl-phospholipid synthase-like methyltransferase